jgi:RAB6A-GEF complex partner protein 2
MSPYIILRDTARTSAIPSSPLSPLATPTPFALKPNGAASEGSLDEFIDYAQALLNRPSSHDPLLSPSAEPHVNTHQLRRTSSLQEPEPQTMKESIDFAILRSSHAPSAATTFRISRAGQPVAVLSLTRPAFRLGEIVHLGIDFSTPRQPSNRRQSYTPSRTPSPLPPRHQPPPSATLQAHTLLASLETTESIDPAIALRSSSSVTRVTRRIHGSVKEFVGFSQRVVLALQIPTSATPEFVTSGVGLNWGIRVEFSVAIPPSDSPPKSDVSDAEDAEAYQPGGSELLEEVAQDDRGVILAPLERVPLETFEVTVPLRIYGAVDAAGLGVGVEGQGADVEGLVV